MSNNCEQQYMCADRPTDDDHVTIWRMVDELRRVYDNKVYKEWHPGKWIDLGFCWFWQPGHYTYHNNLAPSYKVMRRLREVLHSIYGKSYGQEKYEELTDFVLSPMELATGVRIPDRK